MSKKGIDMGYRSQVACVISVNMVKQAHPTKTDVNDDPVYEWVYDKAKFKEMIGFIKLTKFWELWHNETDSIGWADRSGIERTRICIPSARQKRATLSACCIAHLLSYSILITQYL